MQSLVVDVVLMWIILNQSDVVQNIIFLFTNLRRQSSSYFIVDWVINYAELQLYCSCSGLKYAGAVSSSSLLSQRGMNKYNFVPEMRMCWNFPGMEPFMIYLK
jgi:hypothetical protein